MKEKINIAELLKNCPKGMELDCTIWDNLYFDRVEKDLIHCYYESNGYRNTTFFCKNGCYTAHKVSKCVIFPKGKTTWEGFEPPCRFKDGDVVVCEDGKITQMFILKGIKDYENDSYDGWCYFGWDFDDNILFREGIWVFNRLASEEEKQKLFDAIKANGYKWNPETKTLEKLPKFKVGDRVKHKDGYFSGEVTKIDSEYFILKYDSDAEGSVDIRYQDDYELVSNKFDITTLNPFDKVLVRDGNKDKWNIDFFAYYRDSDDYQCMTFTKNQCIPYEGNQHLLGTTDDCDEYYKTWE